MQIELFLLIGVLHGNRIKLSPLSLHSTVCFKLINKIKIFPQLHNQESGREKKRSALQLWSFKKYSWSQFLYVIFKIQISSLNEQDSYIFCQMIAQLMMYIPLYSFIRLAEFGLQVFLLNFQLLWNVKFLLSLSINLIK